MDESEILKLFDACKGSDERYALIMQLGDKLPPFPGEERTPGCLVSGCQSTTYIKTSINEGLVRIQGTSDAKISKGLLALLIFFFEGKEPKELLTLPFTLPEKLGLPELLSPSRSQGLQAMHLHLKRLAIQYL